MSGRGGALSLVSAVTAILTASTALLVISVPLGLGVITSTVLGACRGEVTTT